MHTIPDGSNAFIAEHTVTLQDEAPTKPHIILKSFFSHKLAAVVNSVVIVGLSISLIASMLIAYGRIFRSKKTIMKESQTDGHQNIHEIRHRLLETRIAQIGAALLSIGFALQLAGNFMD